MDSIDKYSLQIIWLSNLVFKKSVLLRTILLYSHFKIYVYFCFEIKNFCVINCLEITCYYKYKSLYGFISQRKQRKSYFTFHTENYIAPMYIPNASVSKYCYINLAKCRTLVAKVCPWKKNHKCVNNHLIPWNCLKLANL